MKVQSILFALAAATLNTLAIADVAAEANVALGQANNNIAAPAGTAVDAQKPGLWGADAWDSDDEDHKEGKKHDDKKCKPGQWACDWDKKKGSGTKVCNVLGKWERTNSCPKKQKCFFNVKNKSPYCIPDY
ncbi:hypothetical protein QBC38DRAFT_453211 [Podospora fimiseda]|uniref:Uncharacterized protein n=1 Tax=Podospora fimiseda TaxID=252190 RepID=A0AAN7BU15_9PEZI|nr:hypothetical protein QBC38DRAFT_453211 [Podospora fimiseda]